MRWRWSKWTALGSFELADEALSAFDANAAASHLSAAIRTFTATGDRRQAALACARLGDLYANAMGNATAARAWFLRATRLIEDEPPCIEQGWVAVAAMGCDVDDLAVLLARAELALARARQFGDVNLETKALADAGLACVQSGRVAEGMAMLDEAMALACGPADNADAAGKSVCSFFTACYFAADFDPAGSWADALRRHGLIGKALGAQLFLSGHCDSVQATAKLGHAGELVDARARTAYRHRIEALRAEIDDALGSGAAEGAEALQAELDQLVGHLAQAFGLGGRSRRASSAAERARLNVTRAVRSATARVTDALPEAGPVLDQRLRTGIYCAYEPDDGDDVRWSVQA